jgi:hypothetical protein
VNAPTELPEGFLSSVMREFGTQWTQILVFSGLIFTAFDVERYLNTGAWVVMTVATFTLTFLFRRSVSPNFARVAITCAAIAIVCVGLPIVVILQKNTAPLEFMQSHKSLSSIYLASAVMAPLATSILSYRLQEDTFGGPLPRELRDAIRKGMVDVRFYKSGQLYELTVLHVESDSLRVLVALKYVLINRTNRTQNYTVGLSPLRPIREFRRVRVADADIDWTNPQYRTQAGISIPWTLAARQECPVDIQEVVDYRRSDSDLYASYLPCEDFTLVLRDIPVGVDVSVESLLGEHVQPRIEPGIKTYVAPGATLPYQGFKVDWSS